MPNPVWYPGDLAVGSHVETAPWIFASAVTFQKASTLQAAQTFQAGQLTSVAVPTSPGTVASGGTVTNSLGYDAVVYASATTGIQAAKLGTATIPGSVNSGNTADYVVPGGSTITLTYTGTLSWTWLAK